MGLPIYNYTIMSGSKAEPYKNPRAPIYIVSGISGNGESVDYFKNFEQPEWSAFRYDAAWGYSHMTVHNGTSLEFDFVVYNDTTKQFGTVDHFWVSKTTRAVDAFIALSG